MNASKYCHNAYAGRVILSKAQTVSIAVCFGLLAPTIFICNAALAIALAKTKQLRVVANWNTMILCISDCLIGSVTLPLGVILFGAFGHQRICWFEMTTIQIVQTNLHFSGYMMLIIAIQRYLQVSPRFSQSIICKYMLTRTGSTITVIVNLVLSLLHGVVSTYFFTYSTSKIPNFILMAINITLVLIVYICYIRLFYEVRRHVTGSNILRQNESTVSSASTSTQNNQRTYYSEFTKTVILILISLAVCTMPYMLMDFWTGWYTLVKERHAPQIIRYFYYLSQTLISLNCAVNALILLYRNKTAANYIKQYLISTVASSVV